MNEATPPSSASSPIVEPVATEAAAIPPSEPTAPPPRKVTLYLVRHGQTTFNVEKRLPGQLPDIHLNEEGVRQAEQLSAALQDLPLTTIISSPLERAQETAAIVRRGHDVPMLLDPRLMDTNVARWAGQKIEDLNKTDPAWKLFVQRPTQPPEGIEGFYDVLKRVVAVAEEARHNEAFGNYIMLVAHADVVKLLIAHYLRLPIEGAGWLGIPNASITALAFEGDHGPSVLALNWLSSPGWLRPPLPVEAPTEKKDEHAGSVSSV